MQLGHDLPTDTLVSAPGKLNGVQSLTMSRGNVTLGIQFCRGSATATLPTGSTVWFGLKDPAAPKGDWLALAQLLPISGSPGLYQAVIALNTPEMIAATHADPEDTVEEIIEFLTYGQLYYFLPASAEPNFSQLVKVTVETVLWTGVEGIAPSPNDYPSVEALNLAIAQAAAAQPSLGHPSANGYALFSNMTGPPFWAVLPTSSVDGTAINPASIGETTPGTGAFTSLSADADFTLGGQLVSNGSSVIIIDGAGALYYPNGTPLTSADGKLHGDGSQVTGIVATVPPTIPGAHTFSGPVTFSVAPVFSNAPGTRTALGLGSLATLNPSGSASATTYLRGDGTWATPASSGGGASFDPTANISNAGSWTFTSLLSTGNVGVGGYLTVQTHFSCAGGLFSVDGGTGAVLQGPTNFRAGDGSPDYVASISPTGAITAASLALTGAATLSGGLSAPTANFSGGIGLFGATPPTAKFARPNFIADVGDILAALGICTA